MYDLSNSDPSDDLVKSLRVIFAFTITTAEVVDNTKRFGVCLQHFTITTAEWILHHRPACFTKHI